MVSVESSQLTVAPRCSSTSPMVRQSTMRGTFSIAVVPSASRAAAISLRAEFLAPPTLTEPDRRLPPETTRRSMERDSMGWRSGKRSILRAVSAAQAQSNTGLGQPCGCPRVLPLPQLALGLCLLLPCILKVDLLLELGVLGQDVDPCFQPSAGHVQEAAVDGRGQPFASLGGDEQRADPELDQHGGVAGQDAHLAFRPSGHHYGGPARPQLTFGRHDEHVEGRGHRGGYPSSSSPPSSLAFSWASSIPPTMKKACSGKWSYSPWVRALNEAMVSSTGVYFPGLPVNCSPTKNGCDRKRSIFRARPTITLSSSDSSSTPRMAMMSWRSL